MFKKAIEDHIKGGGVTAVAADQNSQDSSEFEPPSQG